MGPLLRSGGNPQPEVRGAAGCPPTLRPSLGSEAIADAWGYWGVRLTTPSPEISPQALSLELPQPGHCRSLVWFWGDQIALHPQRRGQHLPQDLILRLQAVGRPQQEPQHIG